MLKREDSVISKVMKIFLISLRRNGKKQFKFIGKVLGYCCIIVGLLSKITAIIA